MNLKVGDKVTYGHSLGLKNLIDWGNNIPLEIEANFKEPWGMLLMNHDHSRDVIGYINYKHYSGSWVFDIVYKDGPIGFWELVKPKKLLLRPTNLP